MPPRSRTARNPATPARTQRQTNNELVKLKCTERLGFLGSTDIKLSHRQNKNYRADGTVIDQDKVDREDAAFNRLRISIVGIIRLWGTEMVNMSNAPRMEMQALVKLVRCHQEFPQKVQRRLWNPDHIRHQAVLHALWDLVRLDVQKVEKKTKKDNLSTMLKIPQYPSFLENQLVTCFVVNPEDHTMGNPELDLVSLTCISFSWNNLTFVVASSLPGGDGQRQQTRRQLPTLYFPSAWKVDTRFVLRRPLRSPGHEEANRAATTSIPSPFHRGPSSTSPCQQNCC